MITGLAIIHQARDKKIHDYFDNAISPSSLTNEVAYLGGSNAGQYHGSSGREHCQYGIAFYQSGLR